MTPPRTPFPRGRRGIGLVAVSAVLGLLALCVMALVVLGVIVSAQIVIAAATGGPAPLFEAGAGRVTWNTVAAFLLPGIVLLFLAVSGLAGIVWLARRAWEAFAAPGAGELAREVTRLHTTLDDVVKAVDDERRRIERDIHDGVQQRVVGLSILLARAERANASEDRAALRRLAREETQNILDELRDVAWRTYPAMLSRDGLRAALEALRDRTSVRVDLQATHERVADRAAETAAYFVASEAVTNALKHAAPGRIEIRTAIEEEHLLVSIRDDGVGGADPTGSGLSGIASRVTARGGRLRVESPVGGPTLIEAVIPCG